MEIPPFLNAFIQITKNIFYPLSATPLRSIKHLEYNAHLLYNAHLWYAKIRVVKQRIILSRLNTFILIRGGVTF